jgi:signal transduction histidine kinase
MRTLGLSLGVLGVALICAMLIQVRLGLRPLERLRLAVADVRSGRRDTVPDAQPDEVQPLATELNALLIQNTTNLERARKHVSNLAHGLKTPLATLAIALQKQPSGSDDLHGLVVLMDRRIRHHLGRARSAAFRRSSRHRRADGPTHPASSGARPVGRNRRSGSGQNGDRVTRHGSCSRSRQSKR